MYLISNTLHSIYSAFFLKILFLAMKKIYFYGLLFVFLHNFLNAQTNISSSFYGINAWMPDSIGSTRYYGKLHSYWQTVKTANPRLVRLGGIAADQNFYTNYQLIKNIDSIRHIGAEPLVQIPLWAGAQSAANAANIVQYLNVTHNKKIKYFSIGNEPNLVYNDAAHGFTSGSYTPPQYADHVKTFSAAMKAIDPTIQILAGELAWYDYTWVNQLLGGAADLTGKNPSTNLDYVDIFTFHFYPFGSTTQNRNDVINSISTLSTNLEHLNTKISAANNSGNRINALKFALTELNVNWQNPSGGDPVNGVGANSFIGGQWLANVAWKIAEKGGAFFNLWSVAEGGDNSRTDIGFLSHTTAAKKPLFYHFQLLAKYFSTTFYHAITNQNNVKVAASKNEEGWAVMLTNFDETTDFNFSLRFDNGSFSTLNTLQINIPNGNLNKEITETLPKNATLLLFFSPKGHYKSKILCRATDITPRLVAHTPTRNKKVFAHYLPWFNTNAPNGAFRGGWCGTGDCSNLSNKQVTYTPLIGEYSQFDRQVLRYHIRMAQAARLDGFIVNINPISTTYQWEITKILCEEANTLKTECPNRDFKIILSYDSGETDSLTIQQYFYTLKNNCYGKAEFSNLIFRDEITNQPILVTWSDAFTSKHKAAIKTVFGDDEMMWIGRNAVGINYFDANFEWVGYLNNDPNNSVNWGQQYFLDMNWAMARQDENGHDPRTFNTLKMAGVYPGFDDRNVPSYWNGGNARYIRRDVADGETMSLTWNMAINYTTQSLGGNVAVTAPFVQVITWNDFPEGTAVEPSALSEYGYRALQTTRRKIAQWKGINPIEAEDSLGLYLVYNLYKAIQQGRTSEANLAKIQFCNAQYSAGQSILPITLLNFNVENIDNKNFIHWKFEDAKNLKRLALLYASDTEGGQMWHTLAQLSITDTAFWHKKQIANFHFYRLQWENEEGKIHFSPIISIEEKNVKQLFYIFPNPVKNILTIDNQGKNIDTIELYDILGRKIMTQTGITEGLYQWHLPPISKGVYWLKIGNQQRRFIIE